MIFILGCSKDPQVCEEFKLAYLIWTDTTGTSGLQYGVNNPNATNTINIGDTITLQAGVNVIYQGVGMAIIDTQVFDLSACENNLVYVATP